jgi:hypothetical protein
MAVDNCKPSSTCFIAIAFETFGMASLIFFLRDIKAAISEMASDQSLPGKTSDMSWNFCTERFLAF